MKKRYFKIACLILSLIMLALAATPVWAVEEVVAIELESNVNCEETHIHESEFMGNITRASCPRGCGGTLVDTCSGGHSHYQYAQCYCTGYPEYHPYNCQTNQDYYYTGQKCSKSCGYYTSGSGTHLHYYSHTMAPMSGLYCPY